jgi:5-methylcytosine-specific restriction protein A
MKLKSVMREVGFLQCECCGTAAEAYPPEYRKSVFEVHHRRPLSEGSTLTGVDDLALLCANCHRAIHTFPNDQMPSVDEFRQQLQKKSE